MSHSIRPLVVATLLLAAAACGGSPPPAPTPQAPAAPAAPQRAEGPRVVVLGFDGVDPDYVEKWKADLPHLAAMLDAGHLHRLGTTTPPQSPVAWSTFATSLNPGGHGIFDFVGRDPATHFPILGTNDYRPPGFDATGRVTRPASATSPRSGLPFWKVAAEAGVPTEVLSVPYSFPPDDLGANGELLSGLGTPDVRLTNSTFFLFGTAITAKQDRENVSGGDLVRLQERGDAWIGRLEGPRGTGRGRAAIELSFQPDPAAGTVHITGEGVDVVAAQGSFSDFVTLEFPVTNFLLVKALVRFRPLVVDQAELTVYMYPLMLDPEDPYLPFSSPGDFAERLAERYGRFKTIGWVHDTSALNSGLLPDGVFIDDMKSIFDQRLAMTLGELKKRRGRLFISVFTATDRASHMFMRLTDVHHPAYDPALAKRYGSIIHDVYAWMDRAVGLVQAELDPDDTLILLSDHGFHSFRRGLNTNTWLLRNGYLALVRGHEHTDSSSLIHGDVDWQRTRAYALGTGQIYINLQGRERDGTVPASDYAAICHEIADKLEQVVDPETGQRALEKVYFRDETWSGARLLDRAPDLQLGFAEGYQTSRATSLGGIPVGLFSDNAKKWSGDHAASNAADTEGFLVVNRDGIGPDPRIEDVAPTVLEILDVPIPDSYEGRSLLASGAR